MAGGPKTSRNPIFTRSRCVSSLPRRLYACINIYLRYIIYNIYVDEKESPGLVQGTKFRVFFRGNYSLSRFLHTMRHTRMWTTDARGTLFIERTPLSRVCSQDSSADPLGDVTCLRRDAPRVHRKRARARFLLLEEITIPISEMPRRARANDGADSSFRWGSPCSQDRRADGSGLRWEERGTMEFHLRETGLLVSEITRFPSGPGIGH